MTKKEKAIRKFTKAMKTANVGYYASLGGAAVQLTPNMHEAWWEFIEGCIEEVNKRG